MELFCFIFAVLCFLAGREVIIIPPFRVQVNLIPKGVTTHVQNKRSDFNRGYFFWDTLYIKYVVVLKLVYSEKYLNIPNGNRTRVSRLPVRLL